MGYLLAIDTSTAYTGIALAGNGGVHEQMFRSDRNHSAELLPAIDGLLEEIGASIADIDRVAVALGPGGYSALRVGLSTAKGLVMPRALPLIGVSTYGLEAMPVWPPAGPLVAVIDAGSSGVAWAEYRPPETGVERQPAAQRRAAGIAQPEELARTAPPPAVFCGEGAGRLGEHVGPERIVNGDPPTRRPSDLVTLAQARFAAGEADDPASLEPEYARAPSITRPKRLRME